MTDKTKARLTISPDTVTVLVGGATEYDDLEAQGLIFHPGSKAKTAVKADEADKLAPEDSTPPENTDEATASSDNTDQEGAS